MRLFHTKTKWRLDTLIDKLFNYKGKMIIVIIYQGMVDDMHGLVRIQKVATTSQMKLI